MVNHTDIKTMIVIQKGINTEKCVVCFFKYIQTQFKEPIFPNK